MSVKKKDARSKAILKASRTSERTNERSNLKRVRTMTEEGGLPREPGGGMCRRDRHTYWTMCLLILNNVQA